MKDIFARLAGEITALLVFRPQVLSAGLGGLGLFGSTASAASGMGGFIPPGAGSAIAGFDIIPGAAALSLAGIGTGTSLAMANIGAAGYFGGFGANMALAGSSLSAGAIGTAIGAAMPYLAPIIAIAALASIFGGSDDSLSVRMRTGATHRDAGGGREGAFGFVNISGDNLGESSKELEDAIIGLDNTMSQFLNPGEIAKVSSRVQDYVYRDDLGTNFSSKEQYNLFAGRQREVFDALGMGGIFDTLTESIKHTKSGIEEMLETTTEFLGLRDAIRDWGKIEEALSPVEQVFNGIEETAKTLREELEEFNLTAGESAGLLEDINKNEQVRKNQLKTEFQDSIVDQILAITDPLAYSLEQQGLIAQQRLDDAERIGANIADVELLNALERESIITQNLGNITAAFETAFVQIESFTNSLGLSSTSPLTPRERLFAAEDLYRSTLHAARQGDAGALSALPGVAQSLLTEASSMFAGTAGFTSRFGIVQGDLERLLDDSTGIIMDPVVSELQLLGRQGVLNTGEITALLEQIRGNLTDDSENEKDAALVA
jgi:hypothetical protein